MLVMNDSVFVLVDVQGKLADVMYERDALFLNLQKLVQGVQTLGIPILWAEQIPEKMGPTIQPLASLLVKERPIAKASFSCWHNDNFRDALKSHARKQVILAGIEAHVCVSQTALDLLSNGFEVYLVSDAVSSRTASNRVIGINRAVKAGAAETSVEMVLFELMQTAEHPAFRSMLKIVK